MKALVKAALIATLGLSSVAAYAASGDATVEDSTINNTASGEDSEAFVDIGSAEGSSGGFLGIGAKQNTGKAVVTGSTINNRASGEDSEARVRIGSAY